MLNALNQNLQHKRRQDCQLFLRMNLKRQQVHVFMFQISNLTTNCQHIWHCQ